MTRPDRYVVVGAVINRELRRRLMAGLAVGLVLGLILGFAIARSTVATSRSASEKPLDLASVPAPAFGDARPVGDVQGQSEAPQPSLTVGSAGVRTDAESGGVSPSPTVPPDWASPAAPSMEPTATVAASMPETSPEPVVVRTAAATPGSTLDANSHNALRGVASWFCLAGRSVCTRGYPASGAFAAAGPALRAALGPGWRGTVVTVSSKDLRVAVKLVDWCRCPGGRVVDLFASAFARLAPLSRGVVAVEVRR